MSHSKVFRMRNLSNKRFGLFVGIILVLILVLQAEGQTRKTTGSGSKVQKVPAKKIAVNSALLDRPMTFRLVSTCDGRVCPGFILAQGVIASTTPKDFERFLVSQAKNEGLSYNQVYFDSPGGSLYGGLLLGRLIRQNELSTTVGSDYLEETEMWDEQGLLPRRPVCYSACAYAFMGGKTRTVATVGKLGLHQFRSTATTDEASTQITMAVLGKYLDDMGIRRKVLDIAALTLPEKIRIINVKEAEALNIISNDVEKGEWTLRNLDDGSLFLTLSQKEYDSQFVLLIFRDGQNYILQMLFSKKQKGRKPSELKEIFNDMSDTEPSLCIVDDRATCLIDIPFRLVEGWRMNEKLVASISLKLSRSALVSIANGSKLEFDPNFPMVYVDVWPNITVSTAKLKGLINALDKSQ